MCNNSSKNTMMLFLTPVIPPQKTPTLEDPSRRFVIRTSQIKVRLGIRFTRVLLSGQPQPTASAALPRSVPQRKNGREN